MTNTGTPEVEVCYPSGQLFHQSLQATHSVTQNDEGGHLIEEDTQGMHAHTHTQRCASTHMYTQTCTHAHIICTHKHTYILSKYIHISEHACSQYTHRHVSTHKTHMHGGERDRETEREKN